VSPHVYGNNDGDDDGDDDGYDMYMTTRI